MSDVIVHTQTLSPYGWTARICAAEKGVPHTVRDVDTTSPEHRRLHPFGKIPVLQHGEAIIYETLAIAHYIDRAFEGPALQPVDYRGQTDMLRWISIVNGYAYPVMNGLIKARFSVLATGAPADPAVLADFQARLAEQLALIEQSLAAHAFLVGDRFTLADAFLFPQLHYASQTPEGAEVLAAAPAARAWLEAMRARASVATTGPFAQA
ncbi:MAG: glutathione S-transferase family protein [Phenylobacterium sp.]|uniref:glutathione S-transferase family protein n=1 Tax=Phenylobacterium sp. TaxID=1871053 RepID=UPI00391A7B0A